MNEYNWAPLVAVSATIALVVVFVGLFMIADYVEGRFNVDGHITIIGGFLVIFLVLAAIAGFK